MRQYRCLSRYIIKEYIFSFLVAFLFFFFIFFVNQILLLAEQILERNVPIRDVLLLVIYSLPVILSYTFPFSSLVGALMTLGQFSSMNEILAMQSSGIPLRRIFAPLLLTGIALSVMSYGINDILIPYGTVFRNRLYQQIINRNPELELEPYSIKQLEQSSVFFVTGNIIDREISDIIILDKTEDNEKRIITARSAALNENASGDDVITFDLKGVFSHTPTSKNGVDYDYARASRMEYNILLKNIVNYINVISPSEMSTRDIYSDIQDKEIQLKTRIDKNLYDMTVKQLEVLSAYNGLKKTIMETGTIDPAAYQNMRSDYTELEKLKEKTFTDRSLQQQWMEFHKKFALPVGCMIFVFLAFPVGMFARRSGRSVGFGLGLLFSVIYWVLLVIGQTLGLKLDFTPVFSMWFPNAVIFLSAVIIMAVRFRR